MQTSIKQAKFADKRKIFELFAPIFPSFRMPCIYIPKRPIPLSKQPRGPMQSLESKQSKSKITHQSFEHLESHSNVSVKVHHVIFLEAQRKILD